MFPFLLVDEYDYTLREVAEMSNSDYVAMRAYVTWKQAREMMYHQHNSKGAK